MPSPWAMKALPCIHLFPIVRIIPRIPLWTFTAFAAFTAFATVLCTQQSFWSEPMLSLDSSFLFDELGDDLIGGGGHHGVFVHHELLEEFPHVFIWDPTKEVEDVLLLTDLRNCLCSVRIGSIGVTGRWPSTENVILDHPIDPRCVAVGISSVL